MTASPDAAATSEVPMVADGSLASALSTVDAQAAQRLTTVGLVYQARQTRLARSAATIAAQQGAGSAQATAAEAAAAAAKMTAARLAVVQQQMTTPAPAVAASAWALHGRVYTAQLEPAVGHCVFLVDAQNAYHSPTGFAYTDSTGYFLLMSPETAMASGTPQPPTLYVQITDTHGHPLYLSTTALAPTLGTATYQTFALPADEQPLGDPPPEVRATALPPQFRHATQPVQTGMTPTAPTAQAPAEPVPPESAVPAAAAPAKPAVPEGVAPASPTSAEPSAPESAVPPAPAPAEPAAPESAVPPAPAAAEPALPESAVPAASAPAGPTGPGHAAPTVPIKIVPAVPATPQLRLRVTNSVDKGRSFALDPGEMTIGREEGSAIRLRGRGVSNNHALLRVHGENVTIEDLRSTNGTKVNGVAIGRQTVLVAGDLIEVGGVRLVVEDNQITSADES